MSVNRDSERTGLDDDAPTIGRPATPRRRDWSLPAPGELLSLFKSYFGLGRRRSEPVMDRQSLGYFLDTRASYIAQTSLYGYLRTRAGQRYPELFDDDPFVESINIAKWQIWLACLSDLAAFAGGALVRDGAVSPEKVSSLMSTVVDAVLEKTGVPHDAGSEFSTYADRVRERIAQCDWAAMSDDEAPFTESPDALVHWAPVMKELKDLDEEIVRNSISFRWQEVRRDLRRDLDVAAVLGSG